MIAKKMVSIISVLVMVFGLTGYAEAYSVSYREIITNGQGNVNMIMKVWAKDGDMRMESTADGEAFVIFIKNDGIYNYIPSQNIVTKIPQMQQRFNYIENPENYIDHLKSMGAQKIGTENTNGYLCDVYKYQDPQTGANAKVWVWTKKNFPVKLTSYGPQGKIEILFTDIKINEPISNELFELPENAQVLDMTNMAGFANMMRQFAE